MTVEELSERIINGTFSEFSQDNTSDNEFAHYGVLGMKWGVRKDRQRKGETDQQYKDRLDRQSRERQAEADRKARSKDQKRQLKAQEKDKKRMLKSQERIEKARLKSQLNTTKANLKAQEKQRKEVQKQYEKQEEQKRKEAAKQKSKKTSKKEAIPVSMMSDEDLRAAINRINMEKQYKDATKKKPGILSKTAKAVVVPVGLAVVKGQLTKMANEQISTLSEKRKAKKMANKAADVVSNASKTLTENFDLGKSIIDNRSYGSTTSDLFNTLYKDLEKNR